MQWLVMGSEGWGADKLPIPRDPRSCTGDRGLYLVPNQCGSDDSLGSLVRAEIVI